MVHVLENGMNVIVQENHTAPVVALQVWVNRGSADDPAGMSGMAHVLEHMVFKGTTQRSAGQIAKEIEGAGGQINAWTSFDQTVFHVVLPSRYFARGLGILADTLQNPRLDQEDLDRELKVIQEEIKQGEDSPPKVVSRELFHTAFAQHPYGRPVIGTAQSVSRLTKSQVTKAFRSWYVPQNMSLVVVGDVSTKAAVGKVKKLFAGGQGKAAPRRRPGEPVQDGLRFSLLERETQETYISLAFKIPELMHQDTPALDLAAIILGQGDSSRLVRRLKHELQVVTDVYAYAYTPKDPGLLIVGATTPPEKAAAALEALAQEVFSLAFAEVTTDEIRRAKTIVESDVVYQKETVQGQARKLGFYHAVAGSVAFEQEYNRRVADTSPAAIRQVGSKYLTPQNCSVAVMGRKTSGQPARQAQRWKKVIAGAFGDLKKAHQVAVERDDGITKFTLKNGARLLVMQDSSVALVTMRAVWNGGLRYETEAQNGVTNLLAALITRGTATRSGDQINEAVENMAGSIGGFSGHNSFGLRSEVLSRHWEQGLEILADCVLHPAFAPGEVEREKRQTLDDISAKQDNLGAVALSLFSRTLYQTHPYRLDPLGTAQSVSRITRAQLVSFYQKHFPPGQMVLAVVGDVDPQRVKEKFSELFGQAGAPRKKSPVSVPQEPPRTAPADAVVVNDKTQAHLVVGFPGATLFEEDRYSLEVLAAVLSGQGGRLFTQLRDRQGLAYQVGAFSLEGIEPGYFAVYLATSPEKIQVALEGIKQQLQAVRQRPVPAQELARVKKYLAGSFEISLQRKATVAALLAFNECYGLGYDAHTRYADAIMNVTAADVLRVARNFLDPDKRVTALVRPEEFSPGALKRRGEAKRAGQAQPKHDRKKGARSRKRQ